VVRMLLRLLEDKNGEVQNLAVRWWAAKNVYDEPALLTNQGDQIAQWAMYCLLWVGYRKLQK
jgi:hypothetical protein